MSLGQLSSELCRDVQRAACPTPNMARAFCFKAQQLQLKMKMKRRTVVSCKICSSDFCRYSSNELHVPLDRRKILSCRGVEIFETVLALLLSPEICKRSISVLFMIQRGRILFLLRHLHFSNRLLLCLWSLLKAGEASKSYLHNILKPKPAINHFCANKMPAEVP